MGLDQALTVRPGPSHTAQPELTPELFLDPTPSLQSATDGDAEMPTLESVHPTITTVRLGELFPTKALCLLINFSGLSQNRAVT